MKVIGQGWKKKVFGRRTEMRRAGVTKVRKMDTSNLSRSDGNDSVGHNRLRLFVGDLWYGVHTQHKGHDKKRHAEDVMYVVGSMHLNGEAFHYDTGKVNKLYRSHINNDPSTKIGLLRKTANQLNNGIISSIYTHVHCAFCRFLKNAIHAITTHMPFPL